ncbi:uncharacterized protein LOC108910973 [Anoplophora glabripennis]|uniref:uncharacterized protein LOC108910973 n=1 Tax=Anoplophora glabripennis TaxID=217634 RepID=UPI00087572D3|nr:uncharacterized protein LOC108910973 [Anoplophora glabripennis]
MSDLKKREDLSKINLIQLREILQRENALLKNNALIGRLPDKGESIKSFRDKVEKEIIFRKNLDDIEATINKLSLSENERHIQKLCEIEKIPVKERYKPFSTLNKAKEVQPDSKVFKIMEDCAHCNKPTKLIPLSESIDILKKQDERIREEQLKARHRRIFEKLRELDENQANEEKNSETSSSEGYSEPEEEEHG